MNIWSHLGVNGVLGDAMSLKHSTVNFSEAVGTQISYSAYSFRHHR